MKYKINIDKSRQYLESINEPEEEVKTTIRNYMNCYEFDLRRMKSIRNYWNSKGSFLPDTDNEFRSNVYDIYKCYLPIRTLLASIAILAMILVVAFFVGMPFPKYDSGVLLDLHEYATGIYENILELLSYIKSFI